MENLKRTLTRWITPESILFITLLLHGSSIGLSDDEAYYWVLAQKPALGYAFHPPAVAWSIASFQALLGWLIGKQAGLVRLPAILGSALILYLSLQWLDQVGLSSSKRKRAAWVLLSFCGFFPLSWMIVPDIPLFLGWTVLFTATWRVCAPPRQDDKKASDSLLMALGSALVLLSKYSGVLAILSSFCSLLFWSSGKQRIRGIAALFLGTLAAFVPILLWNSTHQWASILYQIRDRHGDASLSGLRYARFWLIEIICAGPIALGFSLWVIFKGFFTWPQQALPSKKPDLLQPFIWIWVIFPALVFCIQPLFSDFKPHWALVVWWPAFLLLAWKSQFEDWRWIKFQTYYGVTVGAIVLLACHIPIGGWAIQHWSKNPFDPRLDVTNDLYGWKELHSFIQNKLGDQTLNLPIVASRYQTASQAAFSVKAGTQVTFIPRDMKEWDEWPDLHISEHMGPDWPILKNSVLFVSDNRYDAGPQFPKANCRRLERLEATRFHLLAKWIDIWRCDP